MSVFDLIDQSEKTLKEQLQEGFDTGFLEICVEDVEVTSEETARNALSCSLQARKIKNQIEETRKKIVRPHIDFQKAVMEFSKDMKEKLESIENGLHYKIGDWMTKQRENPFLSMDEISVEDGTISYKKEWDFEMEDEQKIPREFLMINRDLIQDAIKNGVRKIPGIRIFSYEKTSLRVKN